MDDRGSALLDIDDHWLADFHIHHVGLVVSLRDGEGLVEMSVGLRGVDAGGRVGRPIVGGLAQTRGLGGVQLGETGVAGGLGLNGGSGRGGGGLGGVGGRLGSVGGGLLAPRLLGGRLHGRGERSGGCGDLGVGGGGGLIGERLRHIVV